MSGLLATGRPATFAGHLNGIAAALLGAAALSLGLAAQFFPHAFDPQVTAVPFEEVAVTLSSGRTVRVGRYEITYAMWRECHLEGACEYLPKPGRRGSDAAFPVTDVNHLDVEQFIAWLNAKTGLGYRLPTLDEWREIAGVEPGTAKRRLFDDPRLDWAADYGATKSQSRKVKPSGHFGLARSNVADIDGNVWEWTASCVTGNPDPARCPAYFAAGDHIAELPIFLRDAFGGGCTAGTPPSNIGFRLLRY